MDTSTQKSRQHLQPFTTQIQYSQVGRKRENGREQASSNTHFEPWTMDNKIKTFIASAWKRFILIARSWPTVSLTWKKERKWKLAICLHKANKGNRRSIWTFTISPCVWQFQTPTSIGRWTVPCMISIPIKDYWTLSEWIWSQRRYLPAFNSTQEWNMRLKGIIGFQIITNWQTIGISIVFAFLVQVSHWFQ